MRHVKLLVAINVPTAFLPKVDYAVVGIPELSDKISDQGRPVIASKCVAQAEH